MEVITKIKLDLINQYESIQNKIDIKAQTLLATQKISAEFTSKDILDLSEKFNEKCKEVLKQNMNVVNTFDINKAFDMNLLKADCFYTEGWYGKFKNPIGIFVIADWYMNENEKAFIKNLGVRGRDTTDLPGRGFGDLPENDRVKFVLTENLILIKHAFDLSVKQDIIVLNRDFLRDNFKNIECFCLGSLNINTIDNYAFVNCKNLKDLSLEGNEIKTLTAHFFTDNLQNLEHLDVSECGIEIINDNAFNGLKNLQFLRLGQVKIENPNQLNGLKNLRELNLDYGEFETGVNELGIFQNLPNLIELTLRESRTKTLKKSFFIGLNKLENLVMTDCLIDEFESDCFSELTNLKKLNLGGNDIQINKDTFNGLTELEKLKLDYRVDMSSNAFENLKSLRKLTFFFEQIYLREHFEQSNDLKLDSNVIISKILMN